MAVHIFFCLKKRALHVHAFPSCVNTKTLYIFHVPCPVVWMCWTSAQRIPVMTELLCLISITDVFVILTVSGNLGGEVSTKEEEPVLTPRPLLSDLSCQIHCLIILYFCTCGIIRWSNTELVHCLPVASLVQIATDMDEEVPFWRYFASSLLKVLWKFPSEGTSENSWCIETTAIYYFWILNELALLITAELVPFLVCFTYRAFFVCCLFCSLCIVAFFVSALWFAGEIFLIQGKGVMIIPGCALSF